MGIRRVLISICEECEEPGGSEAARVYSFSLIELLMVKEGDLEFLSEVGQADVQESVVLVKEQLETLKLLRKEAFEVILH